MTNLFTRDDTLFGICEGLGDEFGVPANVLRIALGVTVLVAPWVTIAVYAVAGALLLAARTLWPVPSEPAAPPVPASAANDEGAALARAA